MRSESEIISREYEINKGMAVVVVSLSPSMGREPIVTVRTNDVRKWLEAKEDVRLGEAVQGGSFNNNMSRRLGTNKTAADLQMTYVFKILQEETKVEEKVAEEPKAKAAPKKTTTRRSRTTTPKTKPTQAKPAVKKTTTRRSRKKTTTSTSTTVKKGED